MYLNKIDNPGSTKDKFVGMIQDLNRDLGLEGRNINEEATQTMLNVLGVIKNEMAEVIGPEKANAFINEKKRLIKLIKNDLDKAELITTQKMQNRLRLAEYRQIPVTELELSDEEITAQLADIDAEKNAQKAEKADLLMQELIAEEAQKQQQTRKRGPQKNNRKGRTGQAKTKKGAAPAPKKRAKVQKVAPKQIPWSMKVARDLQTNHKLKVLEHPRVTMRWKSRELSVIRGYDSGRYAQMRDAQLKVQRARHYLPGLERIISSNETRELYSFATPQGSRGIFCEIKYANGRIEEGVVYIGYGQDNKNLMIHRYFEPYENFHNQIDIFAGRGSENIEPANNENWKCDSTYLFEKIEADGTIHMTFSNEDHSLRIFPTRPQEAARLASGNQS